MRVFIYEFVCGGGWRHWDPTAPPQGSLMKEGAAMWGALIQDWRRLPGIQVVSTWDARLTLPAITGVEIHPIDSPSTEEQVFARLAKEADGTLVIAPEMGGTLEKWSQKVLTHGGRLWSALPPLIHLAASKNETCQFLAQRGLPVIHGIPWDGADAWPLDFPYPAVWKPDDGAGSWGLSLLEQPNSLRLPENWRIPGRLERLHSGLPASVMVFSWQGKHLVFPPCFQHIKPPDFAYAGGATIANFALANRARRLAQRVAECLSDAQGAWGMDILLGNCESGQEDCIVEINPRYCTSYVGLRAACDHNLAELLASLLCGDACHEPQLLRHVQFTAEGDVRFL